MRRYLLNINSRNTGTISEIRSSIMLPDNPGVLPLSNFPDTEIYPTYFTFNGSIETIIIFRVIVLLNLP